MCVHIRGGRNAKVWLRVLFYIFDELSNIQKEDAILLWLIYVYNSENTNIVVSETVDKTSVALGLDPQL